VTGALKQSLRSRGPMATTPCWAVAGLDTVAFDTDGSGGFPADRGRTGSRVAPTGMRSCSTTTAMALPLHWTMAALAGVSNVQQLIVQGDDDVALGARPECRPRLASRKSVPLAMTRDGNIELFRRQSDAGCSRLCR